MLHLVAHALPGRFPLADDEWAWWLWLRLRRRFPNAIAACLMPDHIHLLLLRELAQLAKLRLAKLLAALTRQQGLERGWRPVSDPQLIPSIQHLGTLCRYTHLNPCRAGLVDDPLAWPWSTHRGVCGAEISPWVDAERMAEALRRAKHDFPTEFHRYVSSDPSVHVAGTPVCAPVPPARVARAPLAEIVVASHVASVWLPRPERRRTAVLLAHQQGWTDPGVVAQAVGLGRTHVARMMRASAPGLVLPAATCLGDARLVRPASPEAISVRRGVSLPAGCALSG